LALSAVKSALDLALPVFSAVDHSQQMGLPGGLRAIGSEDPKLLTAALARLSVEYAIPGVVGVGLVHCSLSAEMEVTNRSSFVPFSFGNELVST
jgi:hypothetical protein